MKKSIIAMSLVSLILTNFIPDYGMASAPAHGPGLISAAAISAIAKESVAEELSVLNAAIAKPTDDSGDADSAYDPDLLKNFVEQTFKTQIDLDELYNKCAFSQPDLINLGNPVLRPEDDVTAARIKSLETVGALYGKDVWKLFSQACDLAQKRFEGRLGALTSNGAKIDFSSDEIKNLSQIIFFPTVAGNAPSLGKEIMTTLFNTAVLGSLVFGPVSALSGMAIGNSFVLIATASSSTNGILDEIISLFHQSPNEKLANLLNQSPVEVNVDLSASEQAQLKTLK